MKKITFLFLFLTAALLFTACHPKTEEKVASTQVDATLFDVHTVSPDALPFSVTLPEEWKVREEQLVYTLSFDDGASGYIQVAKAPLESGTVGCREEATKKYCIVDAGGVLYSVVVSYKTMDATRRAEVEAILGSMQ